MCIHWTFRFLSLEISFGEVTWISCFDYICFFKIFVNHGHTHSHMSTFVWDWTCFTCLKMWHLWCINKCVEVFRNHQFFVGKSFHEIVFILYITNLRLWQITAIDILVMFITKWYLSSLKFFITKFDCKLTIKLTQLKAKLQILIITLKVRAHQ